MTIQDDEWEDAGGYPTEAALKRLEDWPWQDVNAALDFMQSLWHWGDEWCNNRLRECESAILHVEADEKYLRCATGGWSGNESLIAAFEGHAIAFKDKDRWLNAMMRRTMTWRLHAVGGLHIYCYVSLSEAARR